MPPEKDWVEVLQALLTPTVAFAAVMITVFQARINYLRLKHEMFDRRYDMYLATRRFIRRVISIESNHENNKANYDSATKEYLDAIDGAPFIFDWNIDDYFIEVFRKAETFLSLARGFKTSIRPAEMTGAHAAANDLKEWFNQQLGSLGIHSELDKRLERYLHLTQV